MHEDSPRLTMERSLEAYRRMVRIRLFEEEAMRRAMAGEFSGMHSSSGQEAAIVGACLALRDDDYITGTHRSHGHPIGKGADLKPLMAELYGKSTGICRGRGGSMHLADRKVGIIGESAIVGGGIPLATGAGLSIQIRGTDQVSLCFFGDGAANQGTFGESLNLAAIWKLPVIFFCENNLYAISTPVTKSHGQPDIAARAAGYGIPGVIVDGQNLAEVYATTWAAVSRARRGEGPSLIEAKTYRFEEHCLNLLVPIPYRTEQELDLYKSQRDPLVLYRKEMLANGIDDAQIDAIERHVATEVADSVSFARESPLPDPADVYDDLYSMPIHYPPRPSP
jgi:acetoin:2,6-dichlorophenolindophenol oxidoreductase subunit alpha